MITRIEALNYRSLHYINQTLDPFQVLIGPNASGKSTFMDVIAFVAEIINPVPMRAVDRRSLNIRDLTWNGQTDWLELAIEARIPQELIRSSGHQTHLRYELRIGVDPESQELGILVENLWLHPGKSQRGPNAIPERITIPPGPGEPRNWRKVVAKTRSGADYFQPEINDRYSQFSLGPMNSALANLPLDSEQFPATTWFKQFVMGGVRLIALRSKALRDPSPPERYSWLTADGSSGSDGSNLPRLVYELERKSPENFQDWLAHVQTSLPDIVAITTFERPEDRFRYIRIKYQGDVWLPSWVVSDGTLRLLYLTILAYIPDFTGTYLIEEPENGIHPREIETVLQSLSSIYDGQVFITTHSPVFLDLVKPEQLLCFTRNDQSETQIIRGSEHPRLKDWKHEVDLSVLFGSGVLG